MVEGREGRKRVALERVGLPSVLSPIILSSRVSLTNVARSSDPSPIQHDQGRSAIEGVATNPLVYTVQLPLSSCYALRLICDASRDSNRSACRIDRVLPSDRRQRSILCSSDGTNAYNEPCSVERVTVCSNRVPFQGKQNSRLTRSVRGTVNVAGTDSLDASQRCLVKRRSRYP